MKSLKKRMYQWRFDIGRFRFMVRRPGERVKHKAGVRVGNSLYYTWGPLTIFEGKKK